MTKKITRSNPPWLYQGVEWHPPEEFSHEDVYGFVYLITNLTTQRKYVGKKFLWSQKTLPITKTRKRRKKLKVESDWRTYRSSNKTVSDWFNDVDNDQLKLEILRFCSNTKSLTYYELQEQFAHDVLGDDLALNDNLLGKFFRKDLL